MRLRLADFAWLYRPAKYTKACGSTRVWASNLVNIALHHSDMHGEEQAPHVYPFIMNLWQELRDKDLVRDQLLHVLLAGRDTTTCLMSWTLSVYSRCSMIELTTTSFHLVRNSDMFVTLKKEILAVLNDPTAQISKLDIRLMPYLRCCINESELAFLPMLHHAHYSHWIIRANRFEALRLYPQLPVNVRYAIRTTTLPHGGGPNGTSSVVVRKGQGVGWSTYHLHRLQSLYGPDADKYRPERWMDGDLKRRLGSSCGFLDFHAGPRRCLGSR